MHPRSLQTQHMPKGFRQDAWVYLRAMLAIIGVLILLIMLSVIGYNRLTGLYNQAVEARRFQEGEVLDKDLYSATDYRSAAEAYNNARSHFPLSVIARLGGFAALPPQLDQDLNQSLDA
jgi:hypothetical protein